MAPPSLSYAPKSSEPSIAASCSSLLRPSAPYVSVDSHRWIRARSSRAESVEISYRPKAFVSFMVELLQRDDPLSEGADTIGA
ncbi:hypothetical protein LUX01_20420 [Streptomyces sudanensis]|uniref:hypothetical protein n=1 Tax=Streptomyces sudanensis TaxID=436397 RepID=UPI0020CD9F55|nr:hypothetical protein [Streptomyces sudanensis]MCP9988689.1 hypothetical protein [Streptomyces sudanensis]